MNKKIIFLLKLFLTFIILGFIFYKIDIKEFLSIYRKTNLFHIILSIIFYYLAFVFLSIRWKLLLLEHSRNFTVSEIFKIYLLGMLVNTVSPATLGVDVLRGYMIGEKIKSGKSFAFASVLVDRFIGLFGIFSFAPFGILFLKGIPNSKKLIFISFLFSFLIILLFYISWTDIFENIYKKILSRFPFTSLRDKFFKLYDSFKIYSKHKKLLILSYFLTIFLQTFFSIQAYFCARAISINLSPLVFIFIIPLINSLNSIPLTISGLGIREAGFYALFSSYFSLETSVSLSLLYFISGVVANIPFGVYLFKSPFKSEKDI
ncbi:MAG: lysylphosphatidylglycerol synthase transmembrane domain-containing protein [candidate division WOR-3 bacterium]